MWVARDKDNYLGLYFYKPVRGEDDMWYCSGDEFSSMFTGPLTMELPQEMIPELTWEDEPVEFVLISKSKLENISKY